MARVARFAHALDHDVPVDDIVVDAKVDGQHYPIGANLWVKRSDGSKSECTVKAYDPKDKTYTVSLDDGSSGEAISKIVKESKLETKYKGSASRGSITNKGGSSRGSSITAKPAEVKIEIATGAGATSTD